MNKFLLIPEMVQMEDPNNYSSKRQHGETVSIFNLPTEKSDVERVDNSKETQSLHSLTSYIDDFLIETSS